jgi:hypothetical protein
MSEPSGDVQYSEDGNYWWDGSEWQPVQSQDGSDGSDGSQSDPVVDLSQFPTIAALMQVGSTEEWLQYIGVDPSVLSSQQ